MEKSEMRKYKNENQISRMEFEVPVVVYCPLGNNYNKAFVGIEFTLSDTIVDFIDLEKFFKVDLNGAHLTSEELCARVFDVIKTEYNPKTLKVTVESNSHFTIRTIKEL